MCITKEAELLLALKPKFNRAGVWPATPRYLVWRRNARTLEFVQRLNKVPGCGIEEYIVRSGGVLEPETKRAAETGQT